MRITIRVFFRSITIRNHELIPHKGPLMLLANHPSTFMDPIVIAALINRKIYFLAKGELFKSKFTRWLLPKFNMIPVYRKQDDPNQMSKNQDTFKKCFEHLEKNGVILMFPEGISITERKLRPIKTGAARIVLGAEARNDFKLGVQVINVGLNYTDPHRFNRDLFININQPIKVSDYKEEYKKDNFKAAELLTEEIRKQLEKLIIAIEDDKTDELVRNIETIYKYRLSKDNKVYSTDKESEFIITKNIVEAVNYYMEKDRLYVERIGSRIKQYLSDLALLGLDDNAIARDHEKQSLTVNILKAFITIVIGFPVYLYGLVNNFLPFEIPAWTAKKISKAIEFRGAIGMVGGMITFPLFYTIQIFLVWKFTHVQWFTIAYAVSLPLSGIFAYWYFHKVNKIRAKWIMFTLFYKKSVLISSLITEREKIIHELDKIKDEYTQLVEL